MQPTSLLAILTLAGFAAADCYESGLDWYNQDAAAGIAASACEQLLGGVYGPESTFNGQKASCANTPNGKVDFIIKHISEGDRELPAAECYDGLQKEIYSCSKGGETSYENWSYKADPNEGSC